MNKYLLASALMLAGPSITIAQTDTSHRTIIEFAPGVSKPVSLSLISINSCV
jgi:hypothetical protein